MSKINKNYLMSLAPDGGDKGYLKWWAKAMLWLLIFGALAFLTSNAIFIYVQYGISAYIIIVAIGWIINEIDKINEKHKLNHAQIEQK